jgi:hypothetical protein
MLAEGVLLGCDEGSVLGLMVLCDDGKVDSMELGVTVGVIIG